MRSITLLGLSCAIWCVGLLFAPSAHGYSYVMMEDAALLDQSEGVARVTVAKVLPVVDGDERTRYLLTVQTTLAGPALPATEVLSLPGTFDAPNVNLILPGVPRISEGATLLLFYSRNPDGTLGAQQLTLGLFGREQTQAGQVYVRYLEMASDRSKDALRRRYHAPRSPEAFERWIADRARGIKREADYLLTEITELQPAKFNFTVFTFGQLPGAPSGPGRWFQMDSDQSLPWSARPDGQANTSFDEFLSLQQALAAWQNDAGSRILVSYVGTQASSPTCASFNDPGCFTGHVKWNDPDNEIAGAFDCQFGGTLGVGGSLAFSNGQPFNGETWYPRARGRVTIQNNAGCHMDDNAGADGAELLTHEIGHALAFSHSCGDDNSGDCDGRPEANAATMRASAHGDGRGAALAVDDRNGAAVAYPMPAGSNVGPILTPTPGNNSTTNLGGGAIGATVSGNISFVASDGAGSGTTALSCSGSGDVSVASGSPQTIGVGDSVDPVVAQIVLGASSRSGSVTCSVTPQGGMMMQLVFNFTANAGTEICTGDCIFRNSFE